MSADASQNRHGAAARVRREKVAGCTRTPSRWRAIALLIGAGMVLALALAEGNIRLFQLAPSIRPLDTADADSPYQWSDNPVLGYELNRNSPGINTHGQRDIERAVTKPAGARRIILLGDSVLEGRELNALAFDELISRQLERTYEDGRTEVLNFCCGGYSTLAEVELLRTRGLPFQPDVVVVVFVENDFQNVSDGIGIRMARHRPAVVNWAFRHIHLFRLVCVRTGWFHFVNRNDPAQANMAAIGSNNVVEGLRQLNALAQRQAFEAYVAVWPVFLDNGIIDAPQLEGSDALVVEVIANRQGIPVVRLSEYFREHVQRLGQPVNPKQAFTIGDGMHPNAEGSRIAALAIRRALDAWQDKDAVRMPWQEAPEPMVQSALKAAGDLGNAALGARWDYTVARLRGATYWEDRHDPAQAIGQYEEILAEAPNHADANAGLGRLLLEQGDRDRAKHCFERAYQANPDNSDRSLDLGVLYATEGNFGQAKTFFERAVALDPGSYSAHVNLAGLLAQLGDIRGAKHHFEQALQLEPGSSDVHYYLGMLLLNQNALQEAQAQLQKALTLNPEFSDAQQALAVVDARLRKAGMVTPGGNAGRQDHSVHE